MWIARTERRLPVLRCMWNVRVTSHYSQHVSEGTQCYTDAADSIREERGHPLVEIDTVVGSAKHEGRCDVSEGGCLDRSRISRSPSDIPNDHTWCDSQILPARYIPGQQPCPGAPSNKLPRGYISRPASPCSYRPVIHCHLCQSFIVISC